MKSRMLNLFIVDDNPMTLVGLSHYLRNRFGNDIIISTFGSGKSALEKVTADTDIVILDYFLEGENGNDVLKSIKLVNPETEVIMLSANEDMGIAIESFRNGAKDYVLKGKNSWKRITSLVYSVITYPIRIMVKEFGINKYIAIFVFTFLIMGTGIYFALRYIH